jgi:hypothetical protein
MFNIGDYVCVNTDLGLNGINLLLGKYGTIIANSHNNTLVCIEFDEEVINGYEYKNIGKDKHCRWLPYECIDFDFNKQITKDDIDELIKKLNSIQDVNELF